MVAGGRSVDVVRRSSTLGCVRKAVSTLGPSVSTLGFSPVLERMTSLPSMMSVNGSLAGLLHWLVPESVSLLLAAYLEASRAS